MANISVFENEIKSWLFTVFEKDNFRDISIKIEENSAKGDGYLGDLVFLTATAKTQDNSTKIYNLLLKCSKQSETLRKKTPVQRAFLNEIYFYTTVLPYFTKFQEQKQVKAFNSVPKCYGAFTTENKEVIVLENLKKRGFDLWPRKQPLTRAHIEMVIKEYGKFHATSIAVKQEYPEKFEEFVKTFGDIRKEFFAMGNSQNLFEGPIDDACQLFKGELDEGTLNKWQNFKNDIHYIVQILGDDIRDFKVLTHGDCWNNNFMYQSQENKNVPKSVALLDWQIANYTSPILDLSYFLFSCISAHDLQNLNDILAIYHKTFVEQLRSLGVKKPDSVYPFPQLMEDWKKYAKFGIMMASLLMKICSSDKNEMLDMGDTVDKGKDFTEAFSNEISDTHTFKIRTRPIVEYVIKHNLI